MVMRDGGYNAACANNVSTSNVKCDAGFVLDEVNGVCYIVLPTLMDYDEAAATGCPQLDAEVLDFEIENQTKGLLKLLGQGLASILY